MKISVLIPISTFVFTFVTILQMLFSHEAHKIPVKSELHGIVVDSTELDNFECELQDMLKIVEKHMESSEDDDKVCDEVELHSI